MLDWLRDHNEILIATGVVSVLMFVGSLLIAPALLVRIPPDYFRHDERPQDGWGPDHIAWRTAFIIAKNTIGYLLIAMGIVMLVIPGQGLLTMLIGFLLIDFPGKYRVERWVICRPRVLRSINWLREHRGREPLGTGCSDGDGVA